MKIILEPTVETIAVTKWLGHSTLVIPPDGSDAAKLGAFSGKLCYNSFGETGRANAENQARIIAEAHGSVLEHMNITLCIEGVTRALSHEFVRHRAGWAYSQRSTRYTEEGEEPSIVLEPYYAEIHRMSRELSPRSGELHLLDRHLAQIQEAFKQYNFEVQRLLDLNPLGLSGVKLRKWARGKARNVLPHALETKLVVTGNSRAWRHFMGMRSAEGAEAEIRRLAAAVMPHLKEHAPEHFADFTSVEGVDGILTWTPGTWKV